MRKIYKQKFTTFPTVKAKIRDNVISEFKSKVRVNTSIMIADMEICEDIPNHNK
jgi:hypothetical protein